MARHPISNSFITPVKSDGTVQDPSATEFGRGAFTLTASQTYYFPIAGHDSPFLSVHLKHDAAIAITSATIEDCDFPESEVSNYSSDAGDWIPEDPTDAYVGTAGAGTSVTAGVVAVVAGNKGGARWNIEGTGARRTRLAVVVGATGGEVRVSAWGKE